MREHLFRECPSVFVAEAVAYFQAMQLSIHLGLREVKIEGDSRSVIRKLQKEQEDRSEITAFIKDSKSLSLGFQTCVFLFTNRKANKVAHIIASEGIIMRKSTYLENLVPPGATGLVAEDRRRMENMGELRGRRVDEEEEIGF